MAMAPLRGLSVSVLPVPPLPLLLLPLLVLPLPLVLATTTPTIEGRRVGVVALEALLLELAELAAEDEEALWASRVLAMALASMLRCFSAASRSRCCCSCCSRSGCNMARRYLRAR